MSRPLLIRPGAFDNLEPKPASPDPLSAQPPAVDVPAEVGTTWGQFTSTVGLTVPFFLSIAKSTTAAIRRTSG